MAKMTDRIKCPVCASEELHVFFELCGVPAHVGIQWRSRIDAYNCPKGNIRLKYCRSCGFITNSAFDPALMEYRETYDNSLHFSPHFQEYARSLAMRLMDK